MEDLDEARVERHETVSADPEKLSVLRFLAGNRVPLFRSVYATQVLDRVREVRATGSNRCSGGLLRLLRARRADRLANAGHGVSDHRVSGLRGESQPAGIWLQALCVLRRGFARLLSRRRSELARTNTGNHSPERLLQFRGTGRNTRQDDARRTCRVFRGREVVRSCAIGWGA
jgi:hypothetical protein